MATRAEVNGTQALSACSRRGRRGDFRQHQRPCSSVSDLMRRTIRRPFRDLTMDGHDLLGVLASGNPRLAP
jgi:hypothetical protein